MAKITEASQGVQEFIQNVVMEMELDAFASFRYLSITNQKQLVKVAKASPTHEYFIRTSDVVLVYVNEKVWDMLDDKSRALLTRNALNGISWNDEKGKMNVEQPELLISQGCYEAYGVDLVNAAEAVAFALRQIKEQEKEAKASKQSKNKKWTPDQE